MIGLAGIFSLNNQVDKHAREQAIQRMVDPKNSDFSLSLLTYENMTLGLIGRANGNNKDLSLKISENCLVGFAGYGKFRGEKKLYWAEEMINRILSVFLTQGPGCLASIEGSFLCVIYYNSEFFIISDRMGSKNCYIQTDKEMTLFGPSVSGLMDSGFVKRHKNINGVIQILVSGFFLDNSTLVEDIKRFPAATVFRRSEDDHVPVETKPYWTMPKQAGEQTILDQNTINVFNEKMQRAIDELHALESRSVIPLSGGLDSRTIACYLSRKQKLKTITYDFGDETVVASKVCRILNGDAEFFSKKMIRSQSFRVELNQTIRLQQNHSVANQYFYAPLFRKYFMEHTDQLAIFDGVYMDILFSAPYTYQTFGFDQFIKTYGGSVQFVQNHSHSMGKESLLLMMHSLYNGILKDYESCDGVAKSQQCYASGRLRRYVSESYSSRENYCYVFKPGFNYDLMDFGFGLDLKLRKGLIYTALLNKEFPDVMKVRYKDSYNNREKTAMEKMDQKYGRFRARLSSVSQGLIKYYPFQADYYFLNEKGLDAFKDLFVGPNYIPEVFDHETMSTIFNKAKRKQYFMNLLHRILFLQQFFQKNNF